MSGGRPTPDPVKAPRRAGGVRAWVRARTPLEWLVLGAGLACFGGVGWDAALWEPQVQLVLHLMGVAVVVGLALAAWRRRIELPATAIDLPVLALLAAFALATLSALNVGMSLRAMASIVGFALMLPSALLAIRYRPSWVGAIAGVSVLLLSVPALVGLVAHRLEWIVVGGPGLPPLRLGGEGTPFGSVAVPPFVIWPAWALAGLIEARSWRRAVRTGLIAVGVPLTILSGSRSAWLAIGITVAVAGVPWFWRRRARLLARLRLTPSGIAIGAVGVALAGIVMAAVVPRLLEVTSLLYRVSLWRDTLTAWATDPLLGIGPGFMPIARQAAAPDFSFPVRQPHSHNLPLGVLGDAGVIGLAAAVAVVVTLAWVAGPWRTRTRVGRQAAFVLLGIGIGGLFEDITFEPNFNLLAIGLVALVLTDAGAVRWVRLPRIGWRRSASATGAAAVGVVLLAAMVTADAGAIAYRTGVDRFLEGRWGEASAWLERAVSIDPWHPAGPKALAVAADAAGDRALALEAAERATELNPGDAPSWTNVAVLCLGSGRDHCAAAAAERAAATTAFGELDQLNAAIVLDALGHAREADQAYRRSLISQRLTAFGEPWPRPVVIGQGPLGEEVGDLLDLNRLLAWWLVDEPIDPEALDDPSVRALAHAMLGEVEEADAWLERAVAERPDEPLTWQVAAVIAQHRGDADAAERAARIGGVVNGASFPAADTAVEVPDVTFDLATFRRYPGDELVRGATRLLVEPPLPWALEATLPDR